MCTIWKMAQTIQARKPSFDKHPLILNYSFPIHLEDEHPISRNDKLMFSALFFRCTCTLHQPYFSYNLIRQLNILNPPL